MEFLKIKIRKIDMVTNLTDFRLNCGVRDSLICEKHLNRLFDNEVVRFIHKEEMNRAINAARCQSPDMQIVDVDYAREFGLQLGLQFLDVDVCGCSLQQDFASL